MRCGRQTTDRKDSTIKLRINEETRMYLDKRSKLKQISISEYVRNLIEKDMRS